MLFFIVVVVILVGLGVVATRGGSHPITQRLSKKVDLSGPSKFAKLGQVDTEKVQTRAGGGRQSNRLGLGYFAGTKHLLVAPRSLSVFVAGASGSGKTTSVIVPSVLEWQGGMLVASVKHDVMAATYPWRSQLGPVAAFDPAHTLPPEHQQVARPWTPLQAATTWDGAQRTAKTLLDASQASPRSGDGAFWSGQAEMMLAILLYKVSFDADGQMLDVLRLLADISKPAIPGRPGGGGPGEAPLVGIPALAAELKVCSKNGVADAELALLALEFFRGYPAQTLGSVVASVVGAIKVYLTSRAGTVKMSDPNLITPDLLLKQGGTIYVVGTPNAQALYRPLYTAFTDWLMQEAYALGSSQASGRLPSPVAFILDELANVSPIPELDTLVSTARSFDITIVVCVQDLSQLIATYGKEQSDTIINNVGAALLLPLCWDRPTLEWFSSIMGETRVAKESHSKSKSWSRNPGQTSPSSFSDSDNTNKDYEYRPLGSVSQLAMMPEGTGIAVIADQRVPFDQRRVHPNCNEPELERRSLHVQAKLGNLPVRGKVPART